MNSKIATCLFWGFWALLAIQTIVGNFILPQAAYRANPIGYNQMAGSLVWVLWGVIPAFILAGIGHILGRFCKKQLSVKQRFTIYTIPVILPATYCALFGLSMIANLTIKDSPMPGSRTVSKDELMQTKKDGADKAPTNQLSHASYRTTPTDKPPATQKR